MIIPTVRNSDELRFLDGLANQTYDDMEVVVVGPRDDKKWRRRVEDQVH